MVYPKKAYFKDHVFEVDEHVYEPAEDTFLVAEKLETKKEFKIVPGATHLFEEPGALETVADLAVDWFKKELIGEN